MSDTKCINNTKQLINITSCFTHLIYNTKQNNHEIAVNINACLLYLQYANGRNV